VTKPTCVIVGGSGFLGREAVPELSQSYHVIPTSTKPRGGSYRTLDIRDHVALRTFLHATNPAVVVALAANREPDACEENPAEARRLNTDPIAVMNEVLPADVPLLFVSTDYVFDGNNPPYREDSPRNPLSVYGKTKADAEDLALSRPGSIILRVPLLMGWTEQVDQSGFFSQLLKDLKTTSPLALDDVLKRYPVWTRDVGTAMRGLLTSGATGIFHFSTTRPLTRYKAAVEMAHLLGWPSDHLQPSDVIIPRKARRPADAHLDMGKWKSLGYAMPNDFSDVAMRFLQHFDLVPKVA
jgi:dTDP-4-dehydrorhamnose reductase